MTALRVGNCSGFYGDRFSAMSEMLAGGELDVLTGDYLAELTMLILGRDRLKDPSLGYAKTFLRQLETNLGTALDGGVAIVANAGGLNPKGLAEAIEALAARLGLAPRVAYVDGDDLRQRAAHLGFEGALTANAYLGGFGIARALRAGADVVVTGRVTDASLVVGPAAARFGWSPADHDALAGAVVAGHVIECGAQATGGNYSFFTELPRMGRLGFPIAEIEADGSSVITKHPGTGGAVTVGTVTSQLLYEIQDARYLGPDVTTRLDTIELAQDGPDRVRIAGVRGEAPPATLKVSLNHLAGFRNAVEVVLTGLDVEEKAALVREQVSAALTRRPRELTFDLARTDVADADTEEAASALLRITAKDADPAVVGRAFSGAVVELALASIPGFALTAPPGAGAPFGVFTAGYVPATEVAHTVHLPDGTVEVVAPAPAGGEPGVATPDSAAPDSVATEPTTPEPAAPIPGGPTVRVPLGRLFGARSGDKGGSANVGVWARSDAAYAWLAANLTVEQVRELLPETANLPITRTELPNLRAVNLVVDGLLGRGVADQVRFDPQAKGLGEWLRSRCVDVPEALLHEEKDPA